MTVQNFNWFLFNLLAAYFPSMFVLASVAPPTDPRPYLVAPVYLLVIDFDNPVIWFAILGAFWGVLVVLSTSFRSLRTRVIVLTCLFVVCLVQALLVTSIVWQFAGLAH